MVRGWLIAAAFAVPALVPATAAAAGPSLPAPAVAQYVESIPTSTGPVVPGATKPTARKLPAALQEEVAAKGGSDAAVLEQIATSSVYGAPQTTLTPSDAAVSPTPPPETATPAPATPAPATPAPATPKATNPEATKPKAAKPKAAKPKATPTGLPASALESPPTIWTDGSGGSRLPILGAFMLLATLGLAFAGRRTRADAASSGRR
jgi:hypothetical protein